MMYHELAAWSAWDEQHFAEVFQGIARRFDETDDQAQMLEDIRVLTLMREASREWEDSVLAELHARTMTVDRLRAAIEAHRKRAVHLGEERPTLADFGTWDTHDVGPKVVAPVTRFNRRTVETVPSEVSDAADKVEVIKERTRALMAGNAAFTRGTD